MIPENWFFPFLIILFLTFYLIYDRILIRFQEKRQNKILSEQRKHQHIYDAIDELSETLEQSEILWKLLENVMTMVDRQIGIGMWIKDERDRYIFANEQVRALLFKSEPLTDMIGKLDSEIFGMKTTPGIYERLEKAMEGLEPHELPTLPHELFQGGLICNLTDVITRALKRPCRFHEEVNDLVLDVWKTPVLNKNGDVIATVGTLVDVTENKYDRKDQLQYMVATKQAFRINSTRNFYLSHYGFGGYENECKIME